MVVKYSKFFTFTGAITLEPVTILVEPVEADGFRDISIESLEGEYPSHACILFQNLLQRVVVEKGAS